jgi:hypothetical protein
MLVVGMEGTHATAGERVARPRSADNFMVADFTDDR